jgi:hypothetical protein
MIKSTTSKRSRFKYAATLLGVMAVVAAAAIGLTAPSASAKWDLDAYVKCMKGGGNADICCVSTGGAIGPGGQGCAIPPDGVLQVTETPEAPSPFTIGTLAPVATDAPVGPAAGRGGIFVTPSGGVAAP